MKKIRNRKNPTALQLKNIAENLQEKFKCYVTTGIVVHNHLETDTEARYSIYIASEDRPSHQFTSWSALLQFYHKLMKENL